MGKGPFDRLRFGTAGVPHSAATRSTVDGIGAVATLGLDNMEVEFVHGVRMKEEKAREVGELATKAEITLTAHGPYYINLNSQEKKKREASITRILDTARMGHHMGAYSVTFHAAFFMKQDPEKVYGVVTDGMKRIMDTLHDEGIDDLWVRPELSGKPVQFGSIDEIIRVSQDVEGVLPCIDFSHHHARSSGGGNTREAYREIMVKMEEGLGREALELMHAHISGIEYGPKGERNHLNLPDSDMDFRSLVEVLCEFGARGAITCESPNLEEDALLLKNTYLKRRP